MDMEDKDIVKFYKDEFENLKCSKEYYNSLNEEQKEQIINEMFFNASSNIDEDWTELRILEKNENDRWYNRYYNTIVNLYKKYMEKE